MIHEADRAAASELHVVSVAKCGVPKCVVGIERVIPAHCATGA